jgi:predicted ATPase
MSEKSAPNMRMRLVNLNLRAGLKALESSAFVAATSYLSRGVELLPENHWTSDYKLSLELYSTAAEAQFCVGNFEIMKSFCDEVIAQENCSFLDKRRVYNKTIHSIAAKGRFQEAQDLCVEVLGKLQCRFPKHGKTLHAMVGILRTEMSLKKTTQKIPELQTMTDESKIWMMSLLDNLVTYACKYMVHYA